jgi:hypothetical protein
MRNYNYKPHQLQILKEVKGMNLTRLHYLVIQQDTRFTNFTLNELKKHILIGIKNYVKELLGINYKYRCEKDLIQYYCFFETSKAYFQAMYSDTLIQADLKMKLHFHLFISSNFSQVHLPQLINSIIHELSNQKNKYRAVLKVDYQKIDDLENDFVLYHTKQHKYEYRKDFILKN